MVIGLLKREASTLASSKRKKPGVILGIDGAKLKKDRDGNPVSQSGGFPLVDRTRNPVIATGPMGRGKTQMLEATLMDAENGYTHSCILWDFKRTMWKEIGAAREAMGQDVLVVDITRRGKGRVNPLMWIREGDDFVADCQLVANRMTERDMQSGNDKSSHWINAAFSYMTGVIAYVLTAAPDREKNFAGVRRHMIRGDEGSREMARPGVHRLAVEAAEELWSQSLKWEPDEDDGVASADDSRDDKSQAYRTAIYTTCSAMLSDFADDVLEAQTAVSDFDPTDLVCRDRPLTVVISTNPPTARRLRKVYRLVFTQIVDRLTEDIEEVSGKRRVFDTLLGIDEFLEFGIKEVSSWVTYLREYGVKPFFLAQTFESVVSEYGNVIKSSASWVAFNPMAQSEAQLMSDMLGEVEEVAESRSKTSKLTWYSSTHTQSERLEWRPEMTASDMLDLGLEKVFIFGNGKAALTNRILAFCNHTYVKGPAARQWTATATANPWLGRVVPVPERKKKDEATSKSEAAKKRGADNRSITDLLDGFGDYQKEKP